MKKLLLLALATFTLAACSDDDDKTRVPATAVVLDCTEKDLVVGETLQLSATPTPADTDDKVVWSSDDKTVASVSEAGLVTAVAAGTAKISATYGSVSATCTVHVNESDLESEFEVISFEDTEGMKALDGTPVALGEIEVVGGMAAGKHSPAFWAQPFAVEYGDPDGVMGLTFDAPLFSTSDDNVWFGSYYCDCTGFGTQMDTWGGFALSRICNPTATSFDYKNQFAAYTTMGANSTSTFAIAYSNGMMGGQYSDPVIDFVTTPRQVDHLYMATATMVGTYYKYDPTAPADRTYGFQIIGSLAGKEVGSVSVEMVANSVPVSGWVKVNLSSLGKVDQLVFKPEGLNPVKDFDPVYFCLDEIALVKDVN